MMLIDNPGQRRLHRGTTCRINLVPQSTCKCHEISEAVGFWTAVVPQKSCLGVRGGKLFGNIDVGEEHELQWVIRRPCCEDIAKFRNFLLVNQFWTRTHLLNKP